MIVVQVLVIGSPTDFTCWKASTRLQWPAAVEHSLQERVTDLGYLSCSSWLDWCTDQARNHPKFYKSLVRRILDGVI